MLEPQMNFDTHKSIKFLIERGVKEKQAESIVEVINQSRSYDFTKLATRDQLKILEEKIEGRISSLEERLEGKINALEERIEGKINSLEERLRGEIVGVKHDILKWVLPFLISIMGLVIAVIFKH
jgi:hypothetical protein